MRLTTLELLCCPVCRGSLGIAQRSSAAEDGSLRDGVLGCGACGARYPVLDWIPRMLPETDLQPCEREVLARTPVGPARTVPRDCPSPQEFQARIEAKVREKILHHGLPSKLRARAQRDYEYRIRHTEEKGKFVRTARPWIRESPNTILDLGGGQGGTLSAFRRHYHPRTAILLDLDAEWVDVARWRDPETEVIRADAARMPLSDGVVDFLVSTATLEHLPDWKRALQEMVRVSRQGLLCYGPNGRFPYDFGHLDAPLVTCLPKGSAAWVALAWHKLRRTGRSLESIRGQLAETFYIPRSAALRELRSLGVEAHNVFAEFLQESVQEGYHLTGGGVMRTLARHARLRGLFARGLLLLGIEPNVYLFYRRTGKCEPSGHGPTRDAGGGAPPVASA